MIDDDEVRLGEALVKHYGIRVEPHMRKYVLARLRDAGAALAQIPVIGGDARTGVPLRAMIDPTVLLPLPPPTASAM